MHVGCMPPFLTCTFGVVLSSLAATHANVSGGTAAVATASNTPCSNKLLSGALTDTTSVPLGKVRQLNFASSCRHSADTGTSHYTFSHRPFGEPMTGSLGGERATTKEPKKKRFSGSSAGLAAEKLLQLPSGAGTAPIRASNR
jgi:hypothetical protein